LGISAFIDKIARLNPLVDFSDIIERINTMREEFALNFYHGSYFDITNIAILREIIDERSCPLWLRKEEIQSLAAQALMGIFFHTDIGHAKHGLQKLAKTEHPQRISFYSDAALSDYIDPSFYIIKKCLYQQDSFNKGAEISVQPIRVFDGSEKYLTENDIDSTRYFSNDYFVSLLASKTPNAYLIRINFLNTLHHCSQYFFENTNLRQMREIKHIGNIFDPVYIILLNLPTHYLSRILKKECIEVFSLYESNDADSGGTLQYSMPEPLCNAKYIISGRGCIFESGHFKEMRYHADDTHIVHNAYYRFNDYGFLGMAGRLQTGETNRWGDEWNRKYFHGTHSLNYIYGLLSIRLIFKKLKAPVDFFAVPEIKNKYDSLIKLRKEAAELEIKVNLLDLQIPWLLLTELPRIHLLCLVKNDKHTLRTKLVSAMYIDI